MHGPERYFDPLTYTGYFEMAQVFSFSFVKEKKDQTIKNQFSFSKTLLNTERLLKEE